VPADLKREKRRRQEAGAAPSAHRITQGLIAHLAEIAEACQASAIFVYVDALADRDVDLPKGLGDKVVRVTKTPAQDAAQEDRGVPYVRVPNVPLTRQGQAKIAVFIALERGLVEQGDIVVSLSGLADSGSLDSLFVTEVGRELELYSTNLADEAERPPSGEPEVLERVMDIASALGSEGREGKPVGALFVVGDSETVLPLTRQLILNPFHGYAEEDRNILAAGIDETIKELSAIDGAFIVRGDGVVEAAGAYIKVVSQDEFDLPQGLGARHQAAAAVTAVTDATAVAVSESTGTVSIFRGGRILVELEKPRSLGLPRAGA
jgi:DNA integrity scanning protein DisA with diadenylate cyclase activity